MARSKSWDEVRREIGVDEALVGALKRLEEAESRLRDVLGDHGMSATEIEERFDGEDVWDGPGNDDLYLFALGRHVAAAGGRLELRAVFDDGEVLLLREPPEDA